MNLKKSKGTLNKQLMEEVNKLKWRIEVLQEIKINETILKRKEAINIMTLENNKRKKLFESSSSSSDDDSSSIASSSNINDGKINASTNETMNDKKWGIMILFLPRVQVTMWQTSRII